MKNQDVRIEMPLTALRNRETATVVSLGTSLDGGRRGKGWGITKRLMDMGLTPGTQVTVIKAAPFRGPIEVVVKGSRLAIGRGMAERIIVKVIE